jgi:MFS family permease
MVVLGTSLDNFNISATMATYFSLVESFDTSTTTVSWVLSAYALTLGAFIVIAGKITDIFGSENVFILGLLFSSLFALICAVIENSIITLIIFRAFQGIAAAFLMPSAFAFIGNFYSGRALERALSAYVTSITGVLGVGLLLGGAFAETNIGYKGVYYFTFALSLVLCIGLFFFAPAVPRTEEHSKMKVANLDFIGSGVLVIGLLLVVLGLTEGGESWKKPSAYVPVPIGGVLVILVGLYETVYIQRYKDKFNATSVKDDHDQDQDPGKFSEVDIDVQEVNDWRYNLELLFPKEVLKVPNIVSFIIGTLLAYISFISVMSVMVQYYQYVEKQSPIMVGVKTLPMALGLATGALVYRESIAARIGKKVCLVLSPVLVLTMAVWLSRLNFEKKNSYWKYEAFSQFILGYGQNLYFQVYYNSVLTSTPLHLQGVVSGILQTAGQIGICIGNTITSSILGELTISSEIEVRRDIRDKLISCLYMAFASSSLMILLMLSTKSSRNSKNVKNTQERQEKFDSRVPEPIKTADLV